MSTAADQSGGAPSSDGGRNLNTAEPTGPASTTTDTGLDPRRVERVFLALTSASSGLRLNEVATASGLPVDEASRVLSHLEQWGEAWFTRGTWVAGYREKKVGT